MIRSLRGGGVESDPARKGRSSLPNSLFTDEFQEILSARSTTAFPSPVDWRDQWMYFLMVDRFNNPSRPPRHVPFDDPDFLEFQGGKFEGVRHALPYLKRLGVGAIRLSPVLKNFPFDKGAYHGYGIHDFLHAEPRFADCPERADEELRALVDAAHELGIYVISDIVLNHTGNAFAYKCNTDDEICLTTNGAEASFHADPQPVLWRDARGTPQFPSIEAIPNPPVDALVWPIELQQDRFFRRQGRPRPNGDETVGDFASLKQMMTADGDLQQLLIRAYQYVIARYDVDGFRIDTLGYLKGDLQYVFGNAMREFALSIGKKEFFTFGGRYGSTVGIDATLDYALFDNLKLVAKGFAAPTVLSSLYSRRAITEQVTPYSNGDATRSFVTFLDNQDVRERFRFVPPDDPHRFDDQVTLGLACLFSLPGIPCLYYGTEQGLHGAGSDGAVREALWGGPGFNENCLFYREIAKIASARRELRALRQGSLHFRPVSGDGYNFGLSSFSQGVVSFSRIFGTQEVVVVANTNATKTLCLDVAVGYWPGQSYATLRVAYSNKPKPITPGLAQDRKSGTFVVRESNGSILTGPLRCARFALQPLEVQVCDVESPQQTVT